MAGNPFEDASSLVGDLKTEYDQLVSAIPKLRETKKGLVEDVTELNKTVVDTQARHDALLEVIKTRTEAYNTWQAAQLAQLKKSQEVFAKERRDAEDALAIRETELHAAETQIEKEKGDQKAAQQAIMKDQEDIEAQQKTNSAWADRLSADEAYIAGLRGKQETQQTLLDEQQTELGQRETKVGAAETEAAEIIKNAENDRKIARQILANAKDKIADSDARGGALDLREQSLNAKEAKLRQKEAALNDRQNVMISNGTLAP